MAEPSCVTLSNPEGHSSLNLATLPESHPLRNAPLGEIGAEYRNLLQKRWNEARPIKIGKATYNELSGPWVECNEWRVSPELR